MQYVIICFLKKNALLSSDILKIYNNHENADRPTDPIF